MQIQNKTRHGWILNMHEYLMAGNMLQQQLSNSACAKEEAKEEVIKGHEPRVKWTMYSYFMDNL